MSGAEPIKVTIVDDHAVVRRGLAAFLEAEDDLELVGEAEDGSQALEMCRRLSPDVVLMDLVMPGMDGAEATRSIRGELPGTQVIALTSFREEDLVQRAIEAGAIGYLLKDTSGRELAQAIRSAKQGHPTLAPEAAQVLMHAASHRDDFQPGDDLTAREKDILRLMVEGHTNPAIADRLVVSRSTVKFHVSNILMKLGVGSRTEAVAMAIHRGLVD